MPNPKVGLTFFIIEYDISYVSHLEVENSFKSYFFICIKETIEGNIFRSRRGERLFPPRVKIDRETITVHQIVLWGELKNRVVILPHLCL